MSYFDIQVVANESDGQVPVNTFGRRTTVNTSHGIVDVWKGATGTWVPPTQARKHNIASASANDTAAGTGARTVKVRGLKTWADAESSEVVTMNGTSNVETANAYVMINGLEVLTAGSSKTNAGAITATAQTDSTVTAIIAAGSGADEENEATAAILGIPSTQDFYLLSFWASLTGSTGAVGDLGVRVMENADQGDAVFRVKKRFSLARTGTPVFIFPFSPALKVAGPAIIKASSLSVSMDGSNISAGFDGVIRER